MAIAGLVSLVPVAFAGVVALGLRQKEELHGSARFASDMELAKSGLFPKKEVIGNQKYPEILLGKMGKGRFKGHYLCFAGQQFVYLAAPTRSGKGVGIVIPNLLNYRDSVVVLDIKLENFFYSGGYRQSVGQEVFLFSPDGYALTDEARQRGELRSHRWNPLTAQWERSCKMRHLTSSTEEVMRGISIDFWMPMGGMFCAALTVILVLNKYVEPKEAI